MRSLQGTTGPAAPPVTLDVRPIVRQGRPPRDAILAAVDALPVGRGLRLIAPFQPLPMIQLLEGRGFQAEARRLEGGDWEVDFTPKTDAGASAPALTPGSSLAAADWPAPEVLLDLVGLGAEAASAALLQALRKVRPGDVVFAALDHEPDADRLDAFGQPWAGNRSIGPGDAAEYRLLVRRATD